jgi:hypothetical protein
MKKITLREYTNLNDDERRLYDLIIKSMKPRKVIEVNHGFGFHEKAPKHQSIFEYSWSDVISFKQALSEMEGYALFKELVKIAYGVNIDSVNCLDAFNCTEWIITDMEQLVKVEQENLSGEMDDKLKNAGAQELERFEHYPSIDALTGGDITKEDEIMAYPYHRVFMKLTLDKTLGDINKRYIEQK